MQEEIHDKRIVAFSQKFCKRRIEAMNASRKDKTVKEITEKKKSHFSKQKRKRIKNKVKETQKEADDMQE